MHFLRIRESFLPRKFAAIYCIILLVVNFFNWQKLIQKFAMLTHMYRLTAGASLFAAHWEDVRRRATCLCLDCMKSMHTDWNIKVGSQCDATPCIVLVCEMQKFLLKNFSDFFCNQTQGYNAKEHIQVYSSIALHCNEHQRKGDAMQCMV